MRKILACAIALFVAVSPVIAPAMAQGTAAAVNTPPATAATSKPGDAAVGTKNAKAQIDRAKAERPGKADDQKALHDSRRFWAYVGFLAATVVIALFAWRTEVLRDSDPVDFPGTKLTNPPMNPILIARTYSLAQSQMTWWFWIIFASFVFIIIMNYAGSTDTIGGGMNEQVLKLLGISAGTAVGAAIIDQSRTIKGPALTVYNAAMAQLLDPTSTPVQLAAAQTALLTAIPKLQSEGFFRDILTDADGISLHRFQSVAWTFVLGVIFLIGVFCHEIMPQLTDLELTLLGISAGTYLGLKIPEKQT